MAKTDDLQAWRSFIVFARSGTLTAAAKALETEPSSISRAISGLERTLGVELIRHGVRPLVLTDAGRMAHKRMETILRAHDSLMDALKDDNRTLEGKIRLSSAPAFAARHLTTLLQRFQIEHPGITVEILAGLKEADVQKGLCEVATLTGIPTLPNLVYMSRGRNIYVAAASPDYIARCGMPVRPADLRRHSGYVYCGPVRPETKVLQRGSETEAVQYASAVRSTDILAIRAAVLKGMGCAADLPLVQIADDLKAGRLVPILPGWSHPPVECFIVTSRSAWHTKRVRIFLEWYARAMQALFAGFEREASPYVGLPADMPAVDRSQIFMT